MTSCKFAADRVSKKCRCALWATGTIEGNPFRKSLKTRSFERAEQIKRQIENGTAPEQSKKITVEAAFQAFIKDCAARELGRSTFKKYERLVGRLDTFGQARGAARLSDFTPDVVRDFRSTWNVGARTAGKELERLRQIFAFCISNDWITKNPAKGIKAPQVKTLPRIPFSEQEVENITSQARDDQELAFLLTLRHTGLRIGDASLLKDSQVFDNRIYLYTTKAGTPVSILIPDNLASLLKALPTTAGHFFLFGESTHMHSVSNLWRRRIKVICKELGISPDHPHRFRHSLAADLLSKGVSVENVAAILGNSPAVVMKHYSQFVKARQQALDDAMALTFTPKLQRVK